MIGGRSALLAACAGQPFGVKYADPAVLPVGNAQSVAFSPAGDAIAVTHFTSPFISVYQWSSAGFGTRYANPSVLPSVGSGSSVAFTPGGSHLLFAQGGNLFAYSWSSATGFGARVAAPTLDIDVISAISVSPSGNHIAVAGSAPGSSARLFVFPWAGGNFGSPVIAPAATPPGSSLRGVQFSPDGTSLAVVGVSAGMLIYPFNGSSLGTPSQLSTGNTYGVAYSPSGEALAWGGQNGRGVETLDGIGTVRGYNLNFGVSGIGAIAMSANFMAIGSQTAPPGIYVHRRSGAILGNRFSDPSEPPAGAVPADRQLAFSPSGDALAIAHNGSPFITVYRITAQP